MEAAANYMWFYDMTEKEKYYLPTKQQHQAFLECCRTSPHVCIDNYWTISAKVNASCVTTGAFPPKKDRHS